MLARRVIPCLDCDFRNGKVVVLKGTKFKGMRLAGDPVQLAERYQSADELVMLDIGATVQGRETFLKSVSDVASVCSIPLCVGGGIRAFADFEKRIKAGADQCALNTAALENPALISQCSQEFGSQAVVVAVDAEKVGGDWFCFTHAGKKPSGRTLGRWLADAERRGAGEILLTSIDRDGTGKGFDIPMLLAAQCATNMPLIASGGCASVSDMVEVFEKTQASGALAASIFHFGKTTIEDCKAELLAKGIRVRKYDWHWARTGSE